MVKRRSDIDKSTLKQLILIEGKSQREVANELNCTEALISKRMKSYGMSRRVEDDYIGKRFGLLIPLRVSKYDKNSHIVFDCLCDCGREIEVRGNSLSSGNTKTCGCKSRRRGKDHPNFKGFEEISSSYWWSILNGAKGRDIEVKITIEEAWDIFIKQGRRCALTGRKLIFAKVRKKNYIQTASLDRIDSSGIYEISNVQWLHFQVNQMKWSLKQEDFIQVCKEVVSYNTC